jgi:bacteriocin-like protein
MQEVQAMREPSADELSQAMRELSADELSQVSGGCRGGGYPPFPPEILVGI